MAVFDLQTFIQERLRAFDETMDVSSGSPADSQVVQPLLRRLGVDPFTVDLAVFLNDRLKQAFPELATDEGDAVTDLLIKPAVLLWDPIVREIFRIRNGQSFKDPTTLTTDEAEALGANFFSPRERGDFARGVGRILFTQPRTVSITPANFFTSKSGLHFFPDGKQDITLEEMLLNVDGSLYYFDVNLIAEAAGVAYSIDPNELINVANLEGTARVLNQRRFHSGQDEETAATYVDRVQQELTERSMVTLRGIGARVPKAFPEVTRLAVVGFGDPEMQRDVLRGGGLGELLAGGMLGQTALDGTGKPLTRRFQVFDAGVNFTALISAQEPGSYVLTVSSAFSGPPFVRDLPVLRVVSPTILEVQDQVLAPFYASRPWTLRKRELTLSGIPGGILFPDSANGTVTVPDDTVHVGGLYDTSVRGSDFDEATLVIENLTDANPAAAGIALQCSAPGFVTLTDLVLGATYAAGDAVYQAIGESKQFGFTLQILDGPNAGDYRVLNVIQASGTPPTLALDVSIPAVVGSFRWRLIDVLDIDLLEPKDTRVSGNDMQSIQNSAVLTTTGGTDLLALGVSVGDTLRLFDGLDAGDFTVTSLPAFNSVKVDRALIATSPGLNYTIFKTNSSGGVLRPLIRVTKVELLDTSGQPVGSIIPYARPIDVQSRAFENPGRGVKVDLFDAQLGLMSQPQPGGGFVIGGLNLRFRFKGHAPGYSDLVVTFTVGNKSAAAAAAEINAAAALAIGANTILAVVIVDPVNGNRVGIVPIDPYIVVDNGTARAAFFGDLQTHTSCDIRSVTIDSGGGWDAVSPAINQDNLDAVQVLDGGQVGFYGNLKFGSVLFDDVSSSTALVVGNQLLPDTFAAFAPEIGRHIQIGSRSIGSARAFFLEPTSVEFSRNSFFSAKLPDGSALRFFPDPTLDAVRIPAPPSTVLPKDGVSSGGGSTFTSASQDFVLSSILPGDELVIKYRPIIGTVALADPVPVALLNVKISVDDNADQTIILVNDISGSSSNVTRAGVVGQINSAIGKAIAKINSLNQIEFEGDVSIVVRGAGTANTALGLGVSDQHNASAHAGVYPINFVAQNELTLPNDVVIAGFGVESRESYEIRRPGTQRISSTQMSANTAPAGLYYFDVELVSEGTGDLFNIDSDLQLTVENYRSDGYYLSTDDPNLTFSVVERPKLHISRSILEVGVADNPANATQIAGQNVEVTYERSTLVSDVQNFMSSDTERVVCANPLSRHLVPHFVRLDFEYVGGSRADLVSADLEKYIRDLFPADFLESSDLVNLAYRRGATSVVSPIDLVAVVHNYDRSVQAQRSKNSLNTGRLAAFVADVIKVNRRSG